MPLLKSIVATSVLATTLWLGPVITHTIGEASAATSPWMKITKVKGFMTRLAKTKQLPVSFQCKDDPQSSAPLVRVRYKKNQPRVAWVWAWGTGVPKRNGPLLRAGYKRVSAPTYPGFLGLQECGMWHKPNPIKKSKK